MSQGTSRPVADSITTSTRVCSDYVEPSIQKLYGRIIREWSPRRTLRVDQARSHDYNESSSASGLSPDYPWALHLTDSDLRYRLLAFDFDTSKYGPEVARADADELSDQLNDLDVLHLRTRSGPTGGQHIWIRLRDGAEAAAVKELAAALKEHYPTLDIAPLCNPATGVVRGPGAPHRFGGRSLPHLQGNELFRKLDAMRAGSPSAVVAWLLARHPHSSRRRDASPRQTPIRIIDTIDGPRLDRPRRPLSARTKLLMDNPPTTDRSAVAFSILLGMARAGHTLRDVEKVLTSPGLIRLHEDKANGHTFTLAKQWDRALAAAAVFAPAPVEHLPAGNELDERLDTIADTLHRCSAMFARPGGPSDERILHALIQLARTARTTTLDIDCRRLAQATGLDASTISRRLRALEAAAWVSQVQAGSGTAGATWRLNQPPREYCTSATQGIHAPAPLPSEALLSHHAHDLWTPAPGLGPAYARIHLHLTTGTTDTAALAAITGYSLRTVTAAKRAFTRLHLNPPFRSTEQVRRLQLHTAAQRIGASGVLAGRALRHVTERELFAWWNDELAWRRRPGKKRGLRRYRTGSIALPIESTPRVRYGRFPTLGGRADYATARCIVADCLAPRRKLAA